MTRYKVLRRVAEGDIAGEGGVYEVLSEGIETHGPQQAIRAVAKDLVINPDGEVFVAIPASNWTEEPVSTEQPPPRLRVGAQLTVDEVIEDQERAKIRSLAADTLAGPVQLSEVKEPA